MLLPDKAYLAINDDQSLLYMVNLVKNMCNCLINLTRVPNFLGHPSTLSETISASVILEGAVDIVRDDGEVGTGVGNWALDNSEILENRA